MHKLLKTFAKHEDGAVTVDWILLTAAMVGFCIAVYTVLEDSTIGLADAAAAEIQSRDNY
ncbi:hypothetical protein [Tropicibacter naphthalenivorans]|uniref:Flp pilus assembly protein, pilin Flp n=1 Tax=Tropicibacter naphthalenivorans TaxID=441103 RepID=A0A0P1GI45_9RHOB|nr:hypothetical protein [Tropicibacter naphthalenivorans]CUH75711.1 hypothetical protein TRN7648_00579 [Tropicibacter naphthalenivorans]SMC42712.1 hypothetical protein SAMN04488093_101301 [Tropicibacter naphthalenivorans]